MIFVLLAHLLTGPFYGQKPRPYQLQIQMLAQTGNLIQIFKNYPKCMPSKKHTIKPMSTSKENNLFISLFKTYN